MTLGEMRIRKIKRYLKDDELSWEEKSKLLEELEELEGQFQDHLDSIHEERRLERKFGRGDD